MVRSGRASTRGVQPRIPEVKEDDGFADGEREALETVRRGLRDFHDACIAPHWPGIVASFRADLAGRIPLLSQCTGWPGSSAHCMRI
jgi:hypothetical protein